MLGITTPLGNCDAGRALPSKRVHILRCFRFYYKCHTRQQWLPGNIENDWCGDHKQFLWNVLLSPQCPQCIAIDGHVGSLFVFFSLSSSQEPSLTYFFLGLSPIGHHRRAYLSPRGITSSGPATVSLCPPREDALTIDISRSGPGTPGRTRQHRNHDSSTINNKQTWSAKTAL
jgi:hypothetical protein